MSRGNSKPVGSEFTNANGYTYIKTETGWEPKAKIVAEAKLGRPLRGDERAYFKDGNRHNLHPDNIDVKTKRLSAKTPQARIAEIEFAISEHESLIEILKQEKDALTAEIDNASKV